MILFGASCLYLSEKRLSSQDSESKKEALKIVSHFFFVFFFHQLSCVCPHLTHLACHPGPKELRDLVQMMGSQRLKHIMVSFMLY